MQEINPCLCTLRIQNFALAPPKSCVKYRDAIKSKQVSEKPRISNCGILKEL